MVRPVPIPNTAVKRCMADGSGCIASARVGSRRFFINTRRILKYVRRVFLPLKPVVVERDK